MLLDKVKHILCISLILLVGVTTLYACKSDDKELQGEPVLQVQKSIGFKKEGGEVAVPVKSNRDWILPKPSVLYPMLSLPSAILFPRLPMHSTPGSI